jgi:ubiquitin carboxyl-terminal hydrolase 8
VNAAAPPPPPSSLPVNTMNGYPNGADGWRGSDGAGDPKVPVGPFPPIAEISGNADERVLDLKDAPIGRVLDSAKHHFGEAKAMLSNRSSPAGAYWAYLVAYQLVVNEIPYHHDYLDKISANRGSMYREFNRLLKVGYSVTSSRIP